eukprot:Skav217351  [mRNA]  locus=scaffold4442:13637:17938:+ [translate_table: standard]
MSPLSPLRGRPISREIPTQEVSVSGSSPREEAVSVVQAAWEDDRTRNGNRSIRRCWWRRDVIAEGRLSQDGEDSYLEKAKKYDFGKDLGAKYAVGQVWKLTKQDFKYYVIGVGFTMLGAGPEISIGGHQWGHGSAFVMPYFSVQFSLTVNIFNQPPAVLDPKTKNWYAAYNEPLIANNVSNLCTLMQALSIFWLLYFGSMLDGVAPVIAIGGSWAFAKAGEMLCVRVRGALFEALLRQDRSRPTANIASAANFFFTTVIGIGVAMYYSWRFCLCILITMPLLGISSIGVAMNMRAIDGDYSSGIVSESVNSVKTVTAFGLQPVLLEKYEKKLEDWVPEHMTDERGIRKLSALGTGVASGSVFMILAMAVWGINVFISRGLMEVDIATVVVMTLVTTVSAFGELARLISDTQLPQDAARRIFNVIARRSKIDPFSTAGTKLDQVQGHVEFKEAGAMAMAIRGTPVLGSLSRCGAAVRIWGPAILGGRANVLVYRASDAVTIMIPKS